MRSIRVRLFPLNNMKTETESKTEYPFTADQFKALAPDRREVIEAVADYLAPKLSDSCRPNVHLLI
jgi:hypothetical protein